MLGLSQMAGFVTLLIAAAVLFAGTAIFGHSDDGGDGIHDGGDAPSLFSFRNLCLFGVGFGAAGAIATHMGASFALASSVGVGAGVVFALIGWGFYLAISKQQASTNTNTSRLVGKKAIVTIMIPQGRMGQVSTTDEHGGIIYLDARSDEERAFGLDELVFISEATGNLATVSKRRGQQSN